MEPRNKLERSDRPVKKRSGCGLVAIVIAVLAIPAVAAIGFMAIFWVKKADVSEYDMIERAVSVSESTRFGDDDSGMVMLSNESIARISAANIGDELSREQFVAMWLDEHATDLMRKRFAEKANGMRVKWLLRVDEVSAPDSNEAIKASLSMPYRISRGSGWSGSSVSVRADFGPEAVDSLLKVRRGQWVTLEGELRLESNGRNARLLGARVVGQEAEREGR